jgi:RNA polymerase sigma factor (sigma-70 family)
MVFRKLKGVLDPVGGCAQLDLVNDESSFSLDPTWGCLSIARMAVTPAVAPTSKAEQARWFAEEVQPHESLLRSWLRGLFPLMPDMDDLVQESYVRLIRARESGKVSHAKAYLFTTARNIAHDFFRRRKIVQIENIADLATLPVIDDKPGVADAISRQQELEILAKAIRALPERCRQTLTLRLLYGLSHKEIAAQLKISEHTVKAQLATGMRRCTEYFKEHGLVKPGRASEE